MFAVKHRIVSVECRKIAVECQMFLSAECFVTLTESSLFHAECFVLNAKGLHLLPNVACFMPNVYGLPPNVYSVTIQCVQFVYRRMFTV